jgi:hypothetical protein
MLETIKKDVEPDRDGRGEEDSFNVDKIALATPVIGPILDDPLDQNPLI